MAFQHSNDPIVHEAIIALLETLDVFQGLQHDQLRAIARVIEVSEFKAGSYIFEHQDVADSIFLVASGSIHIVPSSDNNTSVLSVCSPGDIIDLAVLGGQMTRTSAALVVSDADIYQLSRTAFKQLQARYPDQFRDVISLLTKTIETIHLKAALQESTLFADLDESILDQLSHEMELKVVPSGIQLINKGDSSDYIYFVVSGRFLAIDEINGTEIPLRDIDRGEVLGEIGVILETSRAVHVRAIRDSTVGRLSKAVFDQLFAQHPAAVHKATTKMIVDHLIAPSRPHGTTIPRTITLSPITNAVPVQKIASMLQTALAHRGAVLTVNRQLIEEMGGISDQSANYSDEACKKSIVNALNDLERSHEHLILVTDDTDTPWTQRCIRQADTILLLADATADPAITVIEQQIKKIKSDNRIKPHLLLLQPSETTIARNTSAWLTPRECAMHHHLRHDKQSDIKRLARFLTGEAIGLVLGAGGGRGLAHIGVFRAMKELNIPIDFIGGTSVGAFIACQIALGWSPDKILEQSKRITGSFAEIPTLPLVSLFSGRRACKVTEQAFGDVLIEDLSMKYFSVSCNISHAGMKIHNSGPVVEAVLASNAAPGIYPPYPHEEGLLVDGAALNSLPVDVMAKANPGGIVLAVNVNPKNDARDPIEYDGALSGWSVLFSRLNPFKKSINVPSMVEVLMRVSNIGGTLEQRKNQETYTDLYIEPPLSDFSIVDYKKIEQLAGVGYDYSKPLLEKWKAESRIL